MDSSQPGHSGRDARNPRAWAEYRSTLVRLLRDRPNIGVTFIARLLEQAQCDGVDSLSPRHRAYVDYYHKYIEPKATPAIHRLVVAAYSPILGRRVRLSYRPSMLDRRASAATAPRLPATPRRERRPREQRHGARTRTSRGPAPTTPIHQTHPRRRFRRRTERSSRSPRSS